MNAYLNNDQYIIQLNNMNQMKSMRFHFVS